jgi:hypothetical protein
MRSMTTSSVDTGAARDLTERIAEKPAIRSSETAGSRR